MDDEKLNYDLSDILNGKKIKFKAENKERLSFDDFCIFIEERYNSKEEDGSIEDIILFLESKIKIAKNSNYKREEWDLLELTCNEAKEEIKKGNIEESCWAFFRMGSLAHHLEGESQEEILELYKIFQAYVRNQKSELSRATPLFSKQYFLKKVKKSVQKIAEEKWKRDENKSIRISKMTKLIWKHLQDKENNLFNHKHFPKKEDSLKPWLREIAPAYAQKRGAPTKDKK